MMRTELAASLAAADDVRRAALLSEHREMLDAELGHALKSLFDDAKGGDLARATGAAIALAALAGVVDNSEISALAAWVTGMAALQIEGQAEPAIAWLESAAAQFIAIGKPLQAAATQVSKLHALALLGSYDEAIRCGLRAREAFLAHGDSLGAGKVEHNLGNIYFRRDLYHEAEQFYRAARMRFAAESDQRQLALVDTSLATALLFQHEFREAARLYEEALARAEATGLSVTRAAIECDLGCHALFQGRYDRALDFLERSRRRYAALGMRHESAIAEQEIADAYLELNLAPEAAAIYERVIPTFTELGMRAEQARALAYHGRTCLLLGRTNEARALLAEARTLYAAEGNEVGEAMVALSEAQLLYAKGYLAAAAEAASRAEAPLCAAGTWGRCLFARWLRGEAARALGREADAEGLLEDTLREAERRAVPQVVHRCHTSLGVLAMAAGESEKAEDRLRRAVTTIEKLRAPLASDQFRTAFVSDKLTPYTELVRLCLTGNRTAEALDYVERAKSRALLETLSGALQFRLKSRDPYEAELLGRLDELREELNWFYSQINRPPSEEGPRGAAAVAALYEAAREREAEVLEITRHLEQCAPRSRGFLPLRQAEPLEIAELQRDLGEETVLVEYFTLDGEFLAFVVTGEGIEAIRPLAREDQLEPVLEQLRFQLSALRYGAGPLRAHLGQLTLRARHYLGMLYDLLLRPIEGRLGARRLLVVPHRALHYVPFHALYDGKSYVIERREVCYAPSAGVLRHCLSKPVRPLRRAALLGLSDPQTPRVRDEITGLAPLFPAPITLLDEQATLAALREQAPKADVLHLACHAHFRTDSPLFSSLRLADGWFTVRDAYSLDLSCGLVTLSACETGMNAVAPGDELIGLARGFFSAGAPSLLLSLWTADDESTASLMASFYKRFYSGESASAALRDAQRELLERNPHPFFWSPFVLLGRW